MSNPNVKLLGGIEIGAVINTKLGKVLITDVISNKQVGIRFLDPFYETYVTAGHLRNNEIKNPMKPSVYDIGFIGVGHYDLCESRKGTKSYFAWRNMFQRVYDKSKISQVRQYEGTSIHAHWHNFQNFAEWYHRQIDGFGPVQFRWHLDKDLLVPGNRIYGPETCCVIPEQINTLLGDHAFKRGILPMGVVKGKNSYLARVNRKGRSRHIGSYPTIRSAQEAYWSAKFEEIRNAAIMYWNYLPESLVMRLINFGWEDAFAYYGDDARLLSDNEGVK